MNYSKGISWFDDCRIPFVDGGWGKRHNKEYPEWKGGKNFTHGEQHLEQNDNGRYPANLLCSDDMLNDGIVSKGNKPSKRNKNHRYSMDYGLKVFDGMDIIGYSDKGSNSRYYDIDKWFDKIINEL